MIKIAGLIKIIAKKLRIWLFICNFVYADMMI